MTGEQKLLRDLLADMTFDEWSRVWRHVNRAYLEGKSGATVTVEVLRAMYEDRLIAFDSGLAVDPLKGTP